MEFFQALFQHTFLQYSVLVGLASSIACGVIGTYVVARRISYLAGSIAHSVLGGLGLAKYLAVVYGITWLRPVHGALVAALAAALTIGLVSLYAREREDTVIGAIWAIGMAVGVIFIALTPGYNQDLMSYLFGNIIMVDLYDLSLVSLLDIVILLVVGLFYRQLMAVTFDQEFARVRGVRVQFFYLLLLCLIGLTVVVLVDVVGIILVIALLTLPAAIANRFSRTLSGTMSLAVLVSVACTLLGLIFAYSPGLPPGAMIILVAGAAYLLVVFGGRLVRTRI